MLGLGLAATLSKGGQRRRARRQERRIARIEERNPERAAKVDARLTKRNEFLDKTGQKIGDAWKGVTGVTAAEKATAAQEEGIQDAMGTLDPYAQAGQDALGAQSDLLGLSGPEAQAAAMEQIQSSPMFTGLVEQGENAILQNAAATGGLRGGDTQGALAQYRPQMLNQAIQQRFQNLGGITGQGLAGAQQQAALAQDLGNVGASGELANYNLQRGFIGDLAGLGMNIASMASGMPPIAGGGGGGMPSMGGGGGMPSMGGGGGGGMGAQLTPF